MGRTGNRERRIVRSNNGVGMTIEGTGIPSRLSRESASNSLLGTLSSVWQSLRRLKQRRTRALRLCESLSLGDRRFVAVVEYANSRFLLGGTSASLVLLAQLPDRSTPPEIAPADLRQTQYGDRRTDSEEAS